MDFLKTILGDELFNQVATAVNAWNGNEANKENQVKLANLSSGEYVGKGKHDALQASYDSQTQELASANELIAELKKSNKGNEALQGQITAYESQVQQLQQKLQDTEIEYALDNLLRDAGVEDRDAREFLGYKYKKQLAEEGKSLELDDNKHIKGGEDIVNSLKTSNPTSFKEAVDDGYKPLDNKGLPKDFKDVTVTKEQFMKMTADERVALKQQNEKLYRSLRG